MAERYAQRMTPLPLEAVLEALEDPVDAAEATSQESGQLDPFPPVLKNYLNGYAGVGLDIRGRFHEGPMINLGLRFHRAPGRIRFKTKRRVHFGERGAYQRGRYEMELPVLVDVVKGVEATEPIAGVKPLVVPSYVWLKVTESPLIASTEPSDSIEVPPEVVRSVIDGELGDPLNSPGQAASKPPQMQLVGQVVQSGPQVEHDLSGPQHPIRLNAGQIAEIEAILAARPCRFGAHGPCFIGWEDPPDFLTETAQVSLCPGPLVERSFEAPGH